METVAYASKEINTAKLKERRVPTLHLDARRQQCWSWHYPPGNPTSDTKTYTNKQKDERGWLWQYLQGNHVTAIKNISMPVLSKITSSSSNWILMSCQTRRVTSGQPNSGHKQIHISNLFSHIYQPVVKSIYKTNHFTNIKHTYTNIRHKFSKN